MRRSKLPQTPFAKRLEKARIAFGRRIGRDDFTWKDFAAMLGLRASTYSRYEVGFVEPNLRMLAKIRAVTGVSLNYLITGKP